MNLGSSLAFNRIRVAPIISFMLVVLVFVFVLCLVSNGIGVSGLSLPFRRTSVHPWLFIGSVLLLLLVLCCLFLEFVFVLRLVFNVSGVSGLSIRECTFGYLNNICIH